MKYFLKSRLPRKSISTHRGLPTLQPKQEEIKNNPASIVIGGGAAGSGKTRSLLTILAQPHLISNPNYRACILRRTYSEINSPGGLADESKLLYYSIGGYLTKNPYDWVFPSGAKISFRHLQHDKDIYSFQGSQITYIALDELPHFTNYMFWYLLSRNRSTCGIEPKVYATCNPDADSWVAKLIDWWIDPETGLPDKNKSGAVRYFVRVMDDLVWGDSYEELKKEYPSLEPKSLSFIPATIYDNPALLKINPQYLTNLLSLPAVERAQLLDGNWKVKANKSQLFSRDWFDTVAIEDLPSLKNARIVRFWDLAATAKEAAKKTSFFTAGVKVAIYRGFYYILDVTWVQKKAGDVEEYIRAVALQDSTAVAVRWELEGGSAGILYSKVLKDKLKGFDTDAVKPIGDKVTRCYNTATAARQHKVFIVEDHWNPTFLNALTSFDGSAQPLINDITDATNGAFHYLTNFENENHSPYSDL